MGLKQLIRKHGANILNAYATGGERGATDAFIGAATTQASGGDVEKESLFKAAYAAHKTAMQTMQKGKVRGPYQVDKYGQKINRVASDHADLAATGLAGLAN